MKLKNKGAEWFVPDNSSVNKALERTTHIGIGAHPDDLEIMAYHGIAECFKNEEKWFLGIVTTDGRASPQKDLDDKISDEEMRTIRKSEQKKAASMGEYSAVALLDYPSSTVKDPSSQDVIADIKHIIEKSRPDYVYTHNLIDKHDTHLAVAIKTVQAIREIKDYTPSFVYGCEGRGSLDWMGDDDTVALDVSANEDLALSLINVFNSQISGGKRYDLAAIGRRRSNATYYCSHSVDKASAITLAMDLTPLVKNRNMDISEYISEYLNRFHKDVLGRLKIFL